jgi:integrase
MAIDTKVALIPPIVLGCFVGIRPYEFHAEGLSRPGLAWEAFNWTDETLEIRNQKIRSKATRTIPLQKCVLAWLKPFQGQKGIIWQNEKAYDDRMRSLKKKAGVRGIHDGYRHSYASYRIRELKQDLILLASEMGNSPQEIIDSYKRNVSDSEATKWFSVLPPKGYDAKIKAVLSIPPKIQKKALSH